MNHFFGRGGGHAQAVDTGADLFEHGVGPAMSAILDVDHEGVGAGNIEVFAAIGKGAHDGTDGGVLESGAQIKIIFGDIHAGGTDDSGDDEIDRFIADGFKRKFIADANATSDLEFAGD